ncbi:hypothetical protein BV22DRAFT_1049115 [Leucogyrophana mollusca]|uniref:Uncharacterized protein n=1 Tax=Leucogyrophana mollusca TaxID=85980 RepID=A0ACB8B8L7_9AGAM|nr:hypothetical protein BV22DRAFT_1049115 [Leucogyrophana mollusca]
MSLAPYVVHSLVIATQFKALSKRIEQDILMIVELGSGESAGLSGSMSVGTSGGTIGSGSAGASEIVGDGTSGITGIGAGAGGGRNVRDCEGGSQTRAGTRRGRDASGSGSVGTSVNDDEIVIVGGGGEGLRCHVVLDHSKGKGSIWPNMHGYYPWLPRMPEHFSQGGSTRRRGWVPRGKHSL